MIRTHMEKHYGSVKSQFIGHFMRYHPVNKNSNSGNCPMQASNVLYTARLDINSFCTPSTSILSNVVPTSLKTC
jgi:hypothetical protein